MTKRKQSKILVVEDNHLTMALLRTVLGSEGYEVLEAATASEGLEVARRSQPDLIIMDIQLPDMSGYDATRILKSENPTKGIPVLVTSAYGDDADKKRLAECGCDIYVPTPISVADFVQRVRRLIGDG
jgi:two-component system, cell cycle response regulator DivK